MILEAAALGLIVGLLTGGTFRAIPAKRFRFLWLVFLSLGCEFFVSTGWMNRLLVDPAWAQGVPWLRGGTAALVFFALLQYLSLGAFLLLHFRKPGLRLVLVGSAGNAAAILANGGRMPVGKAIAAFGTPEQVQAAIERIVRSPHYLYAPTATGGTPLLFLSDVIPFRGISRYMISVGDILIALGVFFFAWYLVRRPRARRIGSPPSRRTGKPV